MRTIVFVIIGLGVASAGAYFGKSDYERLLVSRRNPAVGAYSSAREGGTPVNLPSEASPVASRAEILEAIEREIETVEKSVQDDGVAAGSETAAGALKGMLKDHWNAFLNDAQLLRALDPLRRWELKTSVLAAVVEPIERQNLPERLHRIILTKGRELWALRFRRGVDMVDVDLYPNGTRSIPSGEVEKIDEIPVESFLESERQRISAAANELKKPIDLYVGGIIEFYGLGLEREGYELLERLLKMPDSKQVPSIFVSDPNGTLVRRWEQAAGRVEIDPLRREIEVETAGGSSATDSAETAVPTIVDPTGIATRLREARALVEQARSIYREVVVDQTRDLPDLRKARRQLNEALNNLSHLPRDPDVDRAKQAARNLLQAVIKSLPL